MAPVSRASNSSARQPTKGRWVWQSTKPGAIVRPSSHSASAPGSASAGPTYVMTPSRHATAPPWNWIGGTASAPRSGPGPRAVTRVVAAIAPSAPSVMAPCNPSVGLSASGRP